MLARIRERKDQDGFTLIELLVVMIIIGILAAIAIPIFLNQRKSAHDSAIKSDLRSAATEVESWYVNNQAYPATNAKFKSLPIKTSPGVSLTYTLTSDHYCILGANADASHSWVYKSADGGLQGGSVTTC
ncbi:type II secretion system protein [Demequina lutea]|uniref:Type IV pilus assembly protein PilA n=1 Tax=Demequina lutea TaxID=431489 RepID=A0A7Z0CHD1_9MICO|nr:prepilin-type N-terminal cleavage/methylation domain-containing protein [Demequina lutea]NYI41356.1 type IV pilus assembly protein PilA [Demequina lutea]